MKKKDQKRLTKILFAILARNPFEFGIVPADGGWVSLRDIHWALRQQGVFKSMSIRGLEQFFLLYQPENMELRDKSVRVLPELQSPELSVFEQAEPPGTLYIAVRPRAHAHVLRKGLVPPEGSSWLVLWPRSDEAVNFGRRRDAEPLLGVVNTSVAQAQGAIFFRGGQHIYLSQWLLPAWIELPPLPEKKERKPEKDKKQAQDGGAVPDMAQKQMPGSFIPELPPEWAHTYGKDPGKASRRRDRKNRREKKRWKRDRQR